MTVFCSKCGASVEASDKFCKSCGEIVDAPATTETSVTSEVTPDFNPVLNQPKRKVRKGVWAAVAAVVVVLGGGTAFASTAHVFSSGKTILLDAIAVSPNSTQASSEQHWQIKLKDLSAPNLGSTGSALLSTLNNATLDLNVLFNPAAKQAQVDFNTQYQSLEHNGTVWVSSDSAILSASDYQSLLAPVLPGGVKLPKYLVTDSSQSKAISDFWTELGKNNNKLTKDELASIQKVETYLIQAIPDKYIHRKGLNTVSIEFDQAGLEDILKSEVKTVYDHKDDFATAIGQIGAGTNSSNVSASELKQQFLDGLNQTPEEAILAGISTGLQSGVLSTEPMTISFTKPLFSSQVKEDISGGVSFKDPTSGTSGTVEFTVNATAPSKTDVKLPSVNSSNSQTFTNWAAQAPSN